MVDAPDVVAGKVGVGPDRPWLGRILAGPLAANEDGHAAKLDEDLRRAARDRVGGNRGAEHLDIPFGRGFRVPADDVDVIELEGGIAHRAPLGSGSPARWAYRSARRIQAP